jgi:hypothetical protein
LSHELCDSFIRTVETIELVEVLGPGDARDSWGGALADLLGDGRHPNRRGAA